ncbi:hypothetical protein B0J11DRAFT_331535 [Dendryphion nanum]|uniref:DUF7730 domain-containing protein n=1 Tax=Dendryphion nanum TaxID=256645 RepID=A0A9P9DSA9_9PLEO|nr:hypothetical protein B0J11DRAFT_331535 [Dendryphion nanum]
MAPRKPELQTSAPVKSAKKSGRVRWLENGLLDVKRKGKYAKISENNTNVPFLQLPGEIRNKIYKLVFGGRKFNIVYKRMDLRRRNSHVFHSFDSQKNLLALLRVCRQIYAEGALILYQESIFEVVDQRSLQDLGMLLPVYRNVITRVYLREPLRMDPKASWYYYPSIASWGPHAWISFINNTVVPRLSVDDADLIQQKLKAAIKAVGGDANISIVLTGRQHLLEQMQHCLEMRDSLTSHLKLIPLYERYCCVCDGSLSLSV